MGLQMQCHIVASKTCLFLSKLRFPDTTRVTVSANKQPRGGLLMFETPNILFTETKLLSPAFIVFYGRKRGTAGRRMLILKSWSQLRTDSWFFIQEFRPNREL